MSTNKVRKSTTIVLPKKPLAERGWLSERYLAIDDRYPDILIIRRLLGDKIISIEGSKHLIDVDRSSGRAR